MSRNEQISRWLSKRYITVSSDWLNACVEWVEQQEEVISLEMLQNFVYEQWLQSDLRDIGAAGLLPPNISVINKITLNDSFCLQVNFIKDISKPAFSQLLQLNGIDNENASVTTAPQPQTPTWEAKPKRMLMLYMTDGTTSVQGMEYRTIAHLSTDILPGTKVLLTGPLECRLGVLLLSSENIRVLGGEVENLKEEFSQNQVLRRALGRESDRGSTYRPEQQQNPVSLPTPEMDRFMDGSGMVGTPNGRANSIPTRPRPFGTDPLQPPANDKFCSNALDALQSCDAMEDSKPYLAGLEIPPSESQEQQSEVDDFLMQLDFYELDKLENQNVQRPADEVDEEFLNEQLSFQYDMPNEAQGTDNFMIKIKTPSRLLDQLRMQPNLCKEALWEDGLPFTYLARILESPLPQGTFVVKALITTLLSKLENCPIQGWRLQAKINDGSASLNVDFDDKVISQLIGYSAQEMLILKSKAKTNLELRGKINHAILECRENLLNLNCLMTVRFEPSLSRPKVISFEAMNNHHTEQLYARVRKSTQQLHGATSHTAYS